MQARGRPIQRPARARRAVGEEPVCDSDDPDHAVRGIDCSGAEEGVVESVENLFGRVDPSDRSMRGQRSSPAW